MGTLYELLGALPGDDAESLRAAFRRAAKATHPDINPDDPDAALRFRELVRAYDILIDAEQRTTYDELLAIAGRAPAPKAAPVYETIRKYASNTMAATAISAVLIGGYTLFGQHLSRAPGAAEIVSSATAREPQAVAAAPAANGEASAPVRPRGVESVVSTDAAAAIAAIVPPVREALPAATGPIDLAADDARSHRDRGLFAVREGDMYRALTNFNLAIRYDPGFAEAYVDRGALLYRMRDFDRAFADMAQAKRITESSKARIPLPAPRKVAPIRETRELRRPVRRWPMTAAITP